MADVVLDFFETKIALGPHAAFFPPHHHHHHFHAAVAKSQLIKGVCEENNMSTECGEPKGTHPRGLEQS